MADRKPCSIDGCDNPSNCRGWCKKHYGRWRMHGDPLTVKRPARAPRTPAEVVGVGEKTCSVCCETLPLAAFPTRQGTPDGYGYNCKACRRRAAYRKKYADDAEFRLRRAEHFRRFREAQPPSWQHERGRRTKLMLMYGLTLEDYERMEAEQGGLCAICRRSATSVQSERKQRLGVDHCHTTRTVRGLLCDPCNLTLGLMDDDPERLQAAIDYLHKHAQ